jgi:precorrin-6A/cobalt-precorrin-6A reductase
MTPKKTILLMGGTGEGVALNERLSKSNNIRLLTSLAGRTQNPRALSGEVLKSGFAETGGLRALLAEQEVSQVIDATHPFASGISAKAFEICAALNVPYCRYERPLWRAKKSDRWTVVPDLVSAAQAADDFKRIFLSIGRQQLGKFEQLQGKYFLVRLIEGCPFNPSNSQIEFIQARGPFSTKDELDLLKRYEIEAVVTKNSGGAATFGKIAAARQLGIPVIMVDRPDGIPGKVFTDMDTLINQLPFCV